MWMCLNCHTHFLEGPKYLSDHQPEFHVTTPESSVFVRDAAWSKCLVHAHVNWGYPAPKNQYTIGLKCSMSLRDFWEFLWDERVVISGSCFLLLQNSYFLTVGHRAFHSFLPWRWLHNGTHSFSLTATQKKPYTKTNFVGDFIKALRRWKEFIMQQCKPLRNAYWSFLFLKASQPLYHDTWSVFSSLFSLLSLSGISPTLIHISLTLLHRAFQLSQLPCLPMLEKKKLERKVRV